MSDLIIGTPSNEESAPKAMSADGAVRMHALRVGMWANGRTLDMMALDKHGDVIDGGFREVSAEALEQLCVLYLINRGYHVRRPAEGGR